MWRQSKHRCNNLPPPLLPTLRSGTAPAPGARPPRRTSTSWWRSRMTCQAGAGGHRCAHGYPYHPTLTCPYMPQAPCKPLNLLPPNPYTLTRPYMPHAPCKPLTPPHPNPYTLTRPAYFSSPSPLTHSCLPFPPLPTDCASPSPPLPTVPRGAGGPEHLQLLCQADRSGPAAPRGQQHVRRRGGRQQAPCSSQRHGAHTQPSTEPGGAAA